MLFFIVFLFFVVVCEVYFFCFLFLHHGGEVGSIFGVSLF